MIEHLLSKAKSEGYMFVCQSDAELLFCKRGVPLLSKTGFFAGATVYSGMVRGIIGDALAKGAVVRWSDDGGRK